jgi:hypothetical protein
MKKTCSRCLHDPLKCGVVRTGFAIVEPIPNINDAKTTYTETDDLQVISLPKEVEVLKQIIDDINTEVTSYTITTT